jgi:rhodanese-related sulfurtransferase
MQKPTLQCIAAYSINRRTKILTSSCSHLTAPGIQEDLERLNIRAIISLHKLDKPIKSTIPNTYIALREKDYWHPSVFKTILTQFRTHCKEGNLLIHCKAGRTRSMLTAFALASACSDNVAVLKYGIDVTEATEKRFKRYIQFYHRIPTDIIAQLRAHDNALVLQPCTHN